MNGALTSLGGVRVIAGPSAIGWYAVLTCAGALRARSLGASAAGAVCIGLSAAAAHLACLGVHHAGHALAARRTGNPMLAVRLWGPLASDEYPADEPSLSGSEHVMRALGGPAASALLMLTLVVVAAAFRPVGKIARQLTVFVCLDNLLVFTLGAFLPLSFTDGGTLAHTWRTRE
jgi:hypothetical protein